MSLNYYYKAYENYLWQYEENGSVLTLSNGETIVYREHLLRILERLSIEGLPCFTALLLVLSAGRKKEVNTLLVKYYSEAGYDVQEVTKVYLEGSLTLLKIISQLPEAYRRGDNELVLLQTIFTKSHNQRTTKASENIIKHFREDFNLEEVTSKGHFSNNLKFALRTLHDISLRIKTSEDLLSQMKNLPTVESEELILESVESEEFTVEKLLDDLNEHPLTFRVGSLIKYIWGGIHIPFKNNRPGNQPLGGFADITNKGNFDNLLISEFANEEVVFLSRLANNEALYFQRELPPVDNNLQRVILIDISLKNWGTIKTLSHAIMLAIAHHPKQEEQANVFLIGENYHPAAIQKVSGIIAGLKKLSTNLYPVNGLESYFSNYPAERQEILFITSAETVEYPEMKSLLAEYPKAIDFWIHPSVDGQVKIFKKRGTHKAFVKSIQIPFEEIWKKSKPKPNLNRKSKVLKTQNYPILFSATSRLQCQLVDEDGVVFEISKDGCLFQSPGPPVMGRIRGWQLIMENLPIRIGLFAIGQNEKEERILLLFSPGNKKLILLNLFTRSRKELIFSEWTFLHNHHFEFFGGYFWYVKNQEIVWRIGLNGALTEQSMEGHKNVNAFMKLQLVKRTKPFVTPRYYQVFKRSRVVFINDEDQLIFSTHSLYLNRGGVIKLDHTKKLTVKIASTTRDENVFEFPDGSQITHHRSGMLIFNSSNLAIPAFFVPSLINRALAIASAERFGGAAYFYHEGENGNIRKENATHLFNRYVTEFVKQILHHGA